jgi:multiple sugar transport system permease protein
MSKEKVLKILATIGLSLIALTMTLPFLWMLSASFKFEIDVFKFPVEWIPKKWNAISNYMEVWSGRYSFPLFYLNSIKVTILTTLAQVTVSALGAYAFSKIRFKFRDALFLVYLSMMMIPDQVTIVPKFMVFRWFKLFDTHLGLVLVGSFSIYGMFLLKQYMMSIPESLSESARIDGAGHGKTFLRIILPMTKPAIVTLIMLKFVWTWNDFQNPLIFLQSEHLYTIQLGMTKFMTEYVSYYSLMMVAAVCAIIPLLIVFLIGQRYILEGMAMGAVKG